MSTHGNDEAHHCYLVAHQDARFPLGWRPTYALTLFKDGLNRQLCHLATTWERPDVVRSTALHGYWSPPTHASHKFHMVVVCRWNWGYYLDPAPGPPPTYVVTVTMMPHPSHHDGSIFTDAHGRRVFLNLVTATAQDHERFNAIIANNVSDSVEHNLNLYRYLLAPPPDCVVTNTVVPPPPPPPPPMKVE